MKFLAALRAVIIDDTAVAMAEYALVLAVLAVLSIAGLTAVAVAANSTLSAAYTNFSNIREAPPP